jgi:hypothetical protein
MTLNFPNNSRAYIPGKACVRFWGHDTIIEVTLEVSTEVLKFLVPEIDNSETALLEAFDEHHNKIKNVGKTKHHALRKTIIQLTREDF